MNHLNHYLEIRKRPRLPQQEQQKVLSGILSKLLNCSFIKLIRFRYPHFI